MRELLAGIDQDPQVSQRKLSEDLSVSVGSVNWYLKRCVKKGLVKLSQAPVRRYLYYLTPEGFAEKTRLTASYLSTSFDIFRTGRQQYEALFSLCAANGWKNVVLLGESELAELAVLVISSVDGVIAHCVFDPNSSHKQCAGLPVKLTTDEAIACLPEGCVDAVVATAFDIRSPKIHDLEALRVAFNLDQSRLLIPAFI